MEYDDCSWAWKKTHSYHPYHTLCSHDQIQGRAADCFMHKVRGWGSDGASKYLCITAICVIFLWLLRDLGELCCSITPYLCKYFSCCL